MIKGNLQGEISACCKCFLLCPVLQPINLVKCKNCEQGGSRQKLLEGNEEENKRFEVMVTYIFAATGMKKHSG